MTRMTFFYLWRHGNASTVSSLLSSVFFEFIVPQGPIKDDSQFWPKIIQSLLIDRPLVHTHTQTHTNIYLCITLWIRSICHNVYLAQRENANTAVIPLPQVNGWSLINTRKPTSGSSTLSTPPLSSPTSRSFNGVNGGGWIGETLFPVRYTVSINAD